MNRKFLRLTTPLMRGHDVERAQRRLNNNKYGDFYRGKLDGVFGELTHQAVYRAKYWLGYRKSQLNWTYGPSLDKFLSGKPKLAPLMRARRIMRQRRLAAQKNKKVKALNYAKSQIGVKENPRGSNRVKYSLWYGIIGPWCAMFVSYCYMKAGVKFRYAYVPFVVNDARAGRNGLTVTRSPQPGDVVCYQLRGAAEPNHIGFFDKWLDGSRSRFYALEGNTGSRLSDNNGGEVRRQERSISEVICFVRVRQ